MTLGIPYSLINGSVAPDELLSSALSITYQLPITFSYEQLLNPPFMSHTHPTASSSSKQASNFQLILINALDAYKKRTKKDLLAHPLFTELQSCNSTSAILAVLQQQLQGQDQSRRSDERWARWLDPTVNVLFTFSGIVEEGVGLVRFRSWSCLRSTLSYLSGRYSHQQR